MTDYRAPGGSWTSTLAGATTGEADAWTVALLDADTGEVVIDPAYPNTGAVHTFAHTAQIDMGSDGSHTIVIRNKGGRLVNAPSYAGGSFTGSGSGGTLSAGTYEYAAAFQAPDGKIGPMGPTRTVTITAGQTYTFLFAAQSQYGGTNTNVYRRVAGVGNFKLVASVATNTNSPYDATDTGGAGTTDYAEDVPTLNSTNSTVNVATVVTKTAGIVLHNLASRGSGSGMLNPWILALGLGLDLTQPITTAATDLSLDTNPGARNPVLAIFTHGINDQQGTGTTDTSATLAAYTTAGIQAARHSGADALVTIPAFETANQSQKAETYRAALKAAAEAEDCPWIELGLYGPLPELTAGSTSNDPHLTAARYLTQGDYIYDQILGVVR